MFQKPIQTVRARARGTDKLVGFFFLLASFSILDFRVRFCFCSWFFSILGYLVEISVTVSVSRLACHSHTQSHIHPFID